MEYYIPTLLRFTAPFDCLPAGTEYYDVELTYADCPSFDTTFQFFPGAEYELTGLPPFGAEIHFEAKDASGNTLAMNDPTEGGWLAMIAAAANPKGTYCQKSPVRMARINSSTAEASTRTSSSRSSAWSKGKVCMKWGERR